ncbi:MAG: hypothetical protein OEM01_13935 [Desulfobulbaceae bacterium]|nr:hypothetical protein [Desulfobulbaceae bacterium]
MGAKHKHFDPVNDLTVFMVEGKVPARDYEKTIHDFYHEGPLTKNVLRDLSLSELNHLERSDIVLISLTPRPFLAQGKGGKTAVAASSDPAFGLAKRYEFSSTMDMLPFEVSIFRSTGEAMKWLTGE